MRENLKKQVLSKSFSKDLHMACQEWKITNLNINVDSSNSKCVCGNERLKYRYTIKNMVTEETLYPISSSCIKMFNQKSLNRLIKEYQEVLGVYRLIKSGEDVFLDREGISKTVINHLYRVRFLKGDSPHRTVITYKNYRTSYSYEIRDGYGGTTNIVQLLKYFMVLNKREKLEYLVSKDHRNTKQIDFITNVLKAFIEDYVENEFTTNCLPFKDFHSYSEANVNKKRIAIPRDDKFPADTNEW